MKTNLNIALCLVMLTGFIFNSALAEEIDLLLKPSDMPTLDYLNSKDSTYPQSGYTLTPTDTVKNNTITKYNVKQDGSLEPLYYDVNLKTTTYGAGDSEKYYHWTDDTERIFKETIKDNAQITVKYNASNPQTQISIQEGNTVDNVSGTFLDLPVETGTVINNLGGIGIIKGDFINNSAEKYKGIIYNEGTIDKIEGNFIGNKGTVIENYGGEIDSINGTFVGNEATSISISSYYTDLYFSEFIRGRIGTITGTFIGNKGAAIVAMNGSFDNIIGDFIRNETTVIRLYNGFYSTGYKPGGLYGTISGDFIENKNNVIEIYDSGVSIENANFINNKGTSIVTVASDDSGSGFSSASVDVSNSSFINNEGGVIFLDNWTHGTTSFNSTNNNYVSNKGSVITVKGGDVYDRLVIASISGDNFINNSSELGGAIANYGGLISEIKKSLFIGNSATSKGGAIYNKCLFDYTGINGSFINNYVKSEATDRLALGGAIYTTNSMYFVADNEESVFSGNYTEDPIRGKVENAIFIEPNESYQLLYEDLNTITLETVNNGKIIFNDQIEGGKVNGTTIDYSEQYDLKLGGDETGAIYLNNDVINANIKLSNTNLFLSNRDNVIDNNGLNLNSGQLSMINNQATTVPLLSMQVTGDTDLLVDVDLANKTMDRFETDNYKEHSGNINVKGMNLLSDGVDDTTAIYFAQPELKNNVVNGISEVPDENFQTELYTPIHKYRVTYDTKKQYDGLGDGGYFLFSRGNGSSSDSYNPSVLSSPVTTQTAGHSAMNETFRYVFEHADAFTQLPAMDRLALIKANKYAAASTDFNQNIHWNTDLHNRGAWVRPYTTFESIDLKNGPTVDTITYGTLVGYDTDFRELKNGWTNVGTGYLGYMGSQLNYSGVDTSMNGGLIGLTETFYKGNFWTALTATAGAGVAESQTMYGKEDSTMLLAGLGSKTGYNFEFKEGKFILQPIMFMSYTFVNTFDYTNAAGVRIDNDPMHTIQLHPSVRFITNCKNGWQPYATVGMVWNLLNESSATANNVDLPSMSTKPYVEYGVGLQRRWDDKFTAFIQAMMRQGGRTGIALTAGFRWLLGDEKSVDHISLN